MHRLLSWLLIAAIIFTTTNIPAQEPPPERKQSHRLSDRGSDGKLLFPERYDPVSAPTWPLSVNGTLVELPELPGSIHGQVALKYCGVDRTNRTGPYSQFTETRAVPRGATIFVNPASVPLDNHHVYSCYRININGGEKGAVWAENGVGPLQHRFPYPWSSAGPRIFQINTDAGYYNDSVGRGQSQLLTTPPPPPDWMHTDVPNVDFEFTYAIVTMTGETQLAPLVISPKSGTDETLMSYRRFKMNNICFEPGTMGYRIYARPKGQTVWHRQKTILCWGKPTGPDDYLWQIDNLSPEIRTYDPNGPIPEPVANPMSRLNQLQVAMKYTKGDIIVDVSQLPVWVPTIDEYLGYQGNVIKPAVPSTPEVVIKPPPYYLNYTFTTAVVNSAAVAAPVSPPLMPYKGTTINIGAGMMDITSVISKGYGLATSDAGIADMQLSVNCTSSWWQGIFFRGTQPNSSDGWMARNQNGVLQLYQITDEVQTLKASLSGAPTGPHTLIVTTRGPAITVSVGSMTLNYFDATSNQTGTYVGLYGITGSRFRNFSAVPLPGTLPTIIPGSTGYPAYYDPASLAYLNDPAHANQKPTYGVHKFQRKITGANGTKWTLYQVTDTRDGNPYMGSYYPMWNTQNQYSLVQGMVLTSAINPNHPEYRCASCGICFSDWSGGQAFGPYFLDCHVTVRGDTMTDGIRVVWECQGSWGGHSASEIDCTDCSFSGQIACRYEHNQTANVNHLRTYLNGGPNTVRRSAAWAIDAPNAFTFKGRTNVDNGWCMCWIGWAPTITIEDLWCDQGYPWWFCDYVQYPGAVHINGGKMNFFRPGEPYLRVGAMTTNSGLNLMSMNKVVQQGSFVINYVSPSYLGCLVDTNYSQTVADHLKIYQPTDKEWTDNYTKTPGVTPVSGFAAWNSNNGHWKRENENDPNSPLVQPKEWVWTIPTGLLNPRRTINIDGLANNLTASSWDLPEVKKVSLAVPALSSHIRLPDSIKLDSSRPVPPLVPRPKRDESKDPIKR